MINIISIILSSALVSVITSGIITYIIEKRKYRQEYWKITINKRLETYESIEKILIYFQTTHLIANEPCHLAFFNIETYNKLQVEIAMISWKRNWISTSLYKKLLEINRLLANENLQENQISQFGIKHYSQFADIRDEIIKILPKDYLEMYKVRDFLKRKIKE